MFSQKRAILYLTETKREKKMIKAINKIIENGKNNKNFQAEIINQVSRYVANKTNMSMVAANAFSKSQVEAYKGLNIK